MNALFPPLTDPRAGRSLLKSEISYAKRGAEPQSPNGAAAWNRGTPEPGRQHAREHQREPKQREPNQRERRTKQPVSTTPKSTTIKEVQ